MNILDYVLIAFMVIYAFSGYQQGFLVGAASTLGLLVGGFVGIRVAPLVLAHLSPGFAVTVGALAIVLGLAFLGQALGAYLGHLMRRRVTWRPARVIDALTGAVLSVAAMLLIAWVLGVAVSGAQLPGLNSEVRSSVILGGVNQILPGQSSRVASAFSSIVDSSGFPRYLEPFVPEQIMPVRRPNAAILHRAGVVRDAGSVVRVLGVAPSCDRSLEGSGFIFAAGRVLTNAHVVAGTTRVQVVLRRHDFPAEVVLYNPRVDVAVLDVPGLSAPALHLAGPVDRGRQVAVLGYPENGPYDAEPGRIRSEQRLQSPDIYGDGTVYRDTYSLYALVREGNSGGPVVTGTGRVAGVVFAASVVDSDTGYALTSSQVRRAVDRGRSANREVSTGACTG